MRHALVGLTIVFVACGDSSGPAAGFECAGDTLPTTAPALIQVDGQILGNFLSPGPISNAIVTAFRVGVADSIAIDTSNTPGFYALSLSTGGVPVNGYLRATHSGQVDTYAYPSRPLAGPFTTNVLMPTQGELDFLALAVGVTQSLSNGLIGVVVLDCNGVEVEGATVSIAPAGSSVVRYNAAGAPSTTATSTSTDGIAYVFNVPAGDVTVRANGGGVTLRQHLVNARAGKVTLTEIQP